MTEANKNKGTETAEALGVKLLLKRGTTTKPDTHIAHEVPVERDISEYPMMRQGRAYNTLLYSLGSVPQQRDLFIEGKVTVEKGDFTVTLAKGVGTSAQKTLDALVLYTTNHPKGGGENEFFMPLDWFMEVRGLSNAKEAIKQLKKDIESLKGLGITRRGKGQKKHIVEESWSLYGGYHKIRSDGLTFRATKEFFSCFMSSPVMPMALDAMKSDSRKNPNTYPLFRKILEHKNINIGKTNEDIISVRTLLSVCSKIPSYQTVKEGNRNYRDRIILPFERDMEEAERCGNHFTWRYCGIKGAETEYPLTYEEFIECNIHIDWKDYPDQTKRLTALAEKKKAADRKKRTDKKRAISKAVKRKAESGADEV